MKSKVVVGMSGGVDSSVAAYLLKQQGYDVIGVTMRIWVDEDDDMISENAGCCGLSGVEDARRVCQELGIPYYVMNFKSEFERYVIDYFADEYMHARTPNPCIACNRYVKWKAMLDRCKSIGADYIATGHYARIVRVGDRLAIKKARHIEKDQSYVLYSLTQDELGHTLFPLSGMTKDEVRRVARQAGLLVANKPDSQDICFVPDGDYAKFICEYKAGSYSLGQCSCSLDKRASIDTNACDCVAPSDDCRIDSADVSAKTCSIGITDASNKANDAEAKNNAPIDFALQSVPFVAGNFVDRDGHILGTHKGLIHYTIGQRKGLGISSTHPLYVTKLDMATNEVVLGSSEDVFSSELIASDINFMALDEKDAPDGVRAYGKIRYSHTDAPCTIYIEDSGKRLRAVFDEPVRAVTAGQACVFYDEDGVILCGGSIEMAVDN